MASILMHIGIVRELIRLGHINGEQENRFVLGTLLPDYIIEDNAHFKLIKEGREVFDITAFREKYGDRIKSDPIYTGYYLHLLQDIIFRDLMYNKYNWDPTIPGNIKKLYGDYSALNFYFIERFSITEDMIKEAVRLFEKGDSGFTLNYEEMNGEMESYFSSESVPSYKAFFFTRAMADEFVEKAVKVCLEELSAIRNKTDHLNEKDYSWNKF